MIWYSVFTDCNTAKQNIYNKTDICGIEDLHRRSVFYFCPFIHIEKNINIINQEIIGFPTSMLLHFGAPSLNIERETRKISFEGVTESFEKGYRGCGKTAAFVSCNVFVMKVH